ncbi:MAG: hypothetical protein JXP73_01305 [Deltaproteobacteria bacterium]|nr:hypothetical protein [Deltaproteobacteria bacterium]
MLKTIYHWIDRSLLAVGREMRLSYLPPLMVYMAYGVSGLTSIVGTFFVKDYLGLSAQYLAALGFWVGIPWNLKMPIGHLVDLMWRRKGLLVYLGACLTAASLTIMVLLVGSRDAMTAIMPAEAWYVLSTLLAPVGYVVQDAVADAMTVEAVPRVDAEGRPLSPEQRKPMHTTVQTLGRVAIIGGLVLVAGVNLWMFRGVEHLPKQELVRIYRNVYLMALAIPAISVAGVVLASVLDVRQRRRLVAQGWTPEKLAEMMDEHTEKTPPNWWILGGGLVFVAFTLTVGLVDVPFSQEIVFVGSFAILAFLINKLTRELEPEARATLVGTAVVIFVYRAIPGAGPGMSWWMIDELGFDERFLSVLSLIGGSLTLAGLFIFRRFMAERSIARVVVLLTICGFFLSLPYVGMYYGLHEWTAAHTGGVVDARFIAIIDTTLESPLGQVAMVPMLAWIANSAPPRLKATYFAVMASFTNLSLSLSQLGTKYLNQAFVVTREVKEQATGKLLEAANYAELGKLLIVQVTLLLVLPLAAIAVVRLGRARTM